MIEDYSEICRAINVAPEEVIYAGAPDPGRRKDILDKSFVRQINRFAQLYSLAPEEVELTPKALDEIKNMLSGDTAWSRMCCAAEAAAAAAARRREQKQERKTERG